MEQGKLTSQILPICRLVIFSGNWTLSCDAVYEKYWRGFNDSATTTDLLIFHKQSLATKGAKQSTTRYQMKDRGKIISLIPLKFMLVKRFGYYCLSNSNVFSKCSEILAICISGTFLKTFLKTMPFWDHLIWNLHEPKATWSSDLKKKLSLNIGRLPLNMFIYPVEVSPVNFILYEIPMRVHQVEIKDQSTCAKTLRKIILENNSEIMFYHHLCKTRIKMNVQRLVINLLLPQLW